MGLAQGYAAGISGADTLLGAMSLDPLSKRIQETQERERKQAANKSMAGLFQAFMQPGIDPTAMGSMAQAAVAANPDMDPAQIMSGMQNAQTVQQNSMVLDQKRQANARAAQTRKWIQDNAGMYGEAGQLLLNTADSMADKDLAQGVLDMQTAFISKTRGKKANAAILKMNGMNPSPALIDMEPDKLLEVIKESNDQSNAEIKYFTDPEGNQTALRERADGMVYDHPSHSWKDPAELGLSAAITRTADTTATKQLTANQERKLDYLDKMFDEAQAAKTVYKDSLETQALIDKMPTGQFAKVDLELDKFYSMIGLADAGTIDSVKSAESFLAKRAEAVLADASKLGSGAGFSNTDREFLTKMKGASIDLNAETLKRIMYLERKAAVNTLKLNNAAQQIEIDKAIARGEDPTEWNWRQIEVPKFDYTVKGNYAKIIRSKEDPNVLIYMDPLGVGRYADGTEVPDFTFKGSF